LKEGVLAYAKRLKSQGEWPPSAPIFQSDGNSLFRQFLRHFWLEVHASFPPFLLIDSPPGLGKSITAKTVGRSLDPGFTDDRLAYGHEKILDGLSNLPPMSVLILDDAAASRVLLSRDWARGEQKESIGQILGHARERKVILVILAQSGYELDRIIREDVKPWWITIKNRSMYGGKVAELYHTRQVLIPMRGSHGGWQLGKVAVYYFGAEFDIPAMDAEAVDEYNLSRKAGFGTKNG